MVYKSCPQCGKLNHHNKVKCAECGVCLRVVRGKKKGVNTNLNQQSVPNKGAKVSSQPKSSLGGRPIKELNVPCPSCGHCNDVYKMNKCSKCDHLLLGKGGRPEEE